MYMYLHAPKLTRTYMYNKKQKISLGYYGYENVNTLVSVLYLP